MYSRYIILFMLLFLYSCEDKETVTKSEEKECIQIVKSVLNNPNSFVLLNFEEMNYEAIIPLRESLSKIEQSAILNRRLGGTDLEELPRWLDMQKRTRNLLSNADYKSYYNLNFSHIDAGTKKNSQSYCAINNDSNEVQTMTFDPKEFEGSRYK